MGPELRQPAGRPDGHGLKAAFDISRFSRTNQVILRALKQYGMIMADNGASMFLSGAPDERWNNDDLHLLGSIKASDFEVVEMSPTYTASNLPHGLAPAINSFTANPALATSGACDTELECTGGPLPTDFAPGWACPRQQCER